MSDVALLARIEAKPEYADTVAAMLRDAVDLARQESGTITWFAFREDATTFGIFDTFADDQGRDAHLQGRIAQALMAVATSHLASPPDIRKVGVLASKLP
ncbi:putative quinol monooxygenase [Kitasatospora sp. NBC_00315]|uniref:putative quinol monooxygenase n=1 Tax=Kitasatospora sp. NBC_00315 TaxID=2975963 RepID=UPI00324656F3